MKQGQHLILIREPDSFTEWRRKIWHPAPLLEPMDDFDVAEHFARNVIGDVEWMIVRVVSTEGARS